MIVSSKVTHQQAGITILNYLAGRFTYLTKEQWLERFAEGKILLNAGVASPEDRISTNDIVAYDMPAFTEPDADLAYTIVYEDAWLLGINKPGNLLVHHSGRSLTSNLIYQLRHVHVPAFPQAGVINRLDRETSGVVLIAKNPETLTLMNRLLADKSIVKEYTALVHGVPDPSAGIIDAAIGRKKDSLIKYRFCVDGEQAKHAVTHYETLRIVRNTFALLKLIPETGRTHQLRVHCNSIGHTIIGDKLYGMGDEEFMQWRASPGKLPETMLLSRQALHCSSVRFVHPHTHCMCEIHAPLPDAITAFIQ